MNVLIIDKSKFLAESLKNFLEKNTKVLNVKCFETFPQNLMDWVDLLCLHIYPSKSNRYHEIIYKMKRKKKHVIAITENATQDHVILLNKFGLNGVLSADCSFNDIKTVIIHSLNNKKKFDQQNTNILQEKTLETYKIPYKKTVWGKQLTRSEHNIIPLLLKGYSEKDISQTLEVSEKTVNKHIYSILKKSEQSNVHSLILKFTR